jgi:hypothetical protein
VRALCNWPYLWLRTRPTALSEPDNAQRHALRLRLYGAVWRVVVDVGCGLLLGVVLRRTSAQALGLLHTLGQILHLDVLRAQVRCVVLWCIVLA